MASAPRPSTTHTIWRGRKSESSSAAALDSTSAPMPASKSAHTSNPHARRCSERNARGASASASSGASGVDVEVLLIERFDHGRRHARAVAPVLDERHHHQLRVLGRRVRGEPGVVALLEGELARVDPGLLLDYLRRTGLTRDLDPGQADARRGAALL